MKVHFTEVEGPLTYVYSIVYDHESNRSFVNRVDDREDLSPDRVAAFGSTWEYVGLRVEVQVATTMNWAVPHTVGRASLWGINSDAGSEYFESVLADLKEEAKEDVKATTTALAALSLDHAPST